MPNLELSGRPIEIRYRPNLKDTAGNSAHAATFIRDRLIVLDSELLDDRREHGRILVHEVFHFVWVRLDNAKRRSWEEILLFERRANVRGEAGWSAEWRKRKLCSDAVHFRRRPWREYCCESFCDTAAWLHTGCGGEVTLAKRRIDVRRRWFHQNLGQRVLPI